MRTTWVTRIGIVALVGGLCLVGYGLAHAEKPIKPRFSVLSKDPAWVLDRTTALQWQQAPATEPYAWSTASTVCTDLGNGSRLPEVKELISLVDYSVSDPGPVLPVGAPFYGIQNRNYWSATFGSNPANAWFVDFYYGIVDFSSKVGSRYVWCVR